MERMICLGCNTSVEPTKSIEKDPDGKRWWLVTRCPRERCNYAGFPDSPQPYNKLTNSADKSDKRRNFWKGDHWE